MKEEKMKEEKMKKEKTHEEQMRELDKKIEKCNAAWKEYDELNANNEDDDTSDTDIPGENSDNEKSYYGTSEPLTVKVLENRHKKFESGKNTICHIKHLLQEGKEKDALKILDDYIIIKNQNAKMMTDIDGTFSSSEEESDDDFPTLESDNVTILKKMD